MEGGIRGWTANLSLGACGGGGGGGDALITTVWCSRHSSNKKDRPKAQDIGPFNAHCGDYLARTDSLGGHCGEQRHPESRIVTPERAAAKHREMK